MPDPDLDAWYRTIGVIVVEWGHIANMLRRAVNTLADTHARVQRLESRTGFAGRVNAWSRAMTLALDAMPDRDARRQLEKTVRELREQLPIRNVLSHSEICWGRNLRQERVAIFIVETDAQKARRIPRGRHFSSLPAEAALPRTPCGADVLDPGRYMPQEYELQELMDAARRLPALRHSVQQLCRRVAPDLSPDA